MSLTSVDSDVVMLCLTQADVAMSNGVQNFLVCYRPITKKIDIIDNLDELGVDVCKGLAFYAFTGSDSVSSVHKVEKGKFLCHLVRKNKG